MDEYIERESAIESIMSEPPDAHYPHWYADKINAIPAADVVPVVRCKDCKFWDFGDCYRLELSRPDDFCSYGERKAE